MARVEERIDAGFAASTAGDESALRRVRGDLARMPWVSLVIITIMVLGAALAPLIAPHSPTEQSLPDKLRPPAWQEGGSTKHLLGTDVLGRDVLSRIIYGARVSLIVAAVALLAGGGIGLMVGIVSGYLGGRVDSFLMRVVDATLTFPTILIALRSEEHTLNSSHGYISYAVFCLKKKKKSPSLITTKTKKKDYSNEPTTH